MGNLHRTQVYIEEEQIQGLRLEAEKEHLAVSELIRTAITNFLKSKQRGINWNKDPLTKAIGKIKLTGSDASVNHDHYLYGQRKRK